VADFGIARAAEGDASLTVTGVAVGSPAYMSPEQALGEREVDGRADVYGLGVMAFQMLTGRLPFQATSTPAMLMKHVSEAPPPLASLRPDLPAELVAIVERALAKKPADRWPDARALRDAIAAVERGEAPALGSAPPARRTDVAAPPPADAVPAPVNVPVPVAPAPAPVPAVPPMPAFPAFPVAGGREAREAWREAARAWREQLQAQRHEFVAAQRAWQAEARADAHEARGGYAWTSAMVAPGKNAAAFRRNVITYAMVIGGLAMLNAATSPDFAWVVFPALGWGFGLLGHAGSLRRQGVRPWEALTGRAAVEHDVLVVDVAREGMPAVERRVTGFRRALVRTGVFAASAAAASVAIATTGRSPLIAVLVGCVIGTLVSAASALSRGIGLRRLGVPWRDAWRGTWREQLARRNPALAGRLMDVEVKRLLPADVQEGPYAQVVRDAAADRAAILETMARLGDADRALLPDVVPTVQGLEERIVTLATSLHRLSRDVSEAQLAQLDARLAEAERRPVGADRERTLTLLRRQRETLADLLERRQTLETQLDGAVLLLQTIKLDLLRLRSAGVQSALHDVTSATQEARALSRDIGTALAVADELRAV
jgi:serine/threonine-protein kinase